MSTQKAVTQHGEVEYETEQCDFCDNEFMEKEARHVFIGEVRDRDDWTHRNVYEVEFDSDTYHEQVLCPFCAESRNVPTDVSSSSNNSSDGFITALNNAHSSYIETMIKHLNGKVGGIDADIVIGVFMAGAYIVFVCMLMLPFLLII